MNAPTRRKGNERVGLIFEQDVQASSPSLVNIDDSHVQESHSLSLSLTLSLLAILRANTFDCFLSVRETEKLCSRNWILANASFRDERDHSVARRFFFHKVSKIEFPEIRRSLLKYSGK